jgi:hypothetical protein
MAGIMDDPTTRAIFLKPLIPGESVKGDTVIVHPPDCAAENRFYRQAKASFEKGMRGLAGIERIKLGLPVDVWLAELEDKNPKAYEALGSADIARLRELLNGK